MLWQSTISRNFKKLETALLNFSKFKLFWSLYTFFFWFIFRCETGLLKGFNYPCFPIMESRRLYSKCQALTRSFAVCKRGQPEQINSLTSFIDASQVYGSSTEEPERFVQNVVVRWIYYGYFWNNYYNYYSYYSY